MKKEEIKVLLIEDDSNLGAITWPYLYNRPPWMC